MNSEETRAERLATKNKIFKMIRRLGIVQVWIGLFVLCLCIAIRESISEPHWLHWSRADFSVCILIIITGSIGIASGIHQISPMLNGTFMALSILCALLSLLFAIKSGFSLRYVSDNWFFDVSSGMLVHTSLFVTLIFEVILSSIAASYCFNAANGCFRRTAQGTESRPTPQFPLFTTPNGQMMIIPPILYSNNNIRATQQQTPPASNDENWTWM
ncbi:uncharacterized protein LOC130613675 isoform X2 [Hydractinia symbiolongicarpus]|uniref:uncharacterized protein LOC130613675 isoform X2 n=1 Tax=Hydractinia symbiolongicarpus TaxID=13093 RepID=UPI00254E0C73|nr:uncharacterized protein LOC130613675 isoform X2 [Hydractinia symbiolongicarpus]XP_057290982.1 uncharacterized protein LOC130613675 isoform X2 [Hydractinia symbiolongicarpus]